MVVAAQIVAVVSDRGASATGYRVLLHCWTLAGLSSVVLTVIAFVRGKRSRWLLMPALLGALVVLGFLADIAFT
jgi:hypothetical protein